MAKIVVGDRVLRIVSVRQQHVLLATLKLGQFRQCVGHVRTSNDLESTVGAVGQLSLNRSDDAGKRLC